MGGERTPLADRRGALTVGSRSLPIGERHAASSYHRVDRPARGGGRRRRRLQRLERMSYRLEWISGAVLFGTVLLLLIVPEFALIALLLVSFAVLVALVTLTAVALASPYLLVRSLRRRRARPTTGRRTRWMHPSSAMPGAQSLRRKTGRRQAVPRPVAVRADATKVPNR